MFMSGRQEIAIFKIIDQQGLSNNIIYLTSLLPKKCASASSADRESSTAQSHHLSAAQK